MINLNTKDIGVEASKKKIIELLLYNKQKLGLINTKIEYKQEYEKYKKILDSKELVSCKTLKGKTNSKDFNDNLQTIYLNLLTVFNQMNTTCDTIDEHKKLNTAIINNLKTKLSKIEDNLTVLENTVDNSDTEIHYTENFRNVDSFETNKNYYTNDDENESIIYDGFLVNYDKYNECIKLPKTICLNKILSSNGQKIGSITVNEQLGGGFYNIKNPNNNIDKAMDTDMESYWEEVIMSDDPIKVELDKDRYYGIKHGAVCQCEIVFNNISKINEINLLTFGEFPMELVAIRYYNTDQPDQEEEMELKKNKSLKNLEILSPTNPNLKNCFIKDSLCIQFPHVTAKRLRIIFNQIHYIKNNFVYNKAELDKNQLWTNKNNISFDGDCLFSETYKDKFKDPTLAVMTKSLENKKFNIDNLKNSLFPDSNKTISVMKYEYNYGLYNIEINENIYKPIGIYVSKMINLTENIDSFILETKETIPENTSIDYYVSFSKTPNNNKWFKIKANETNALKDLLKQEYNIIKEKEKFFGTQNKYIELENTPFIHDNNVNIQLSVIDENGISIKCTNVTDYNIPSKSYKNFTKDNNEIQYFINKNRIFFNRSLNKNTIIDIEYEHLINSIRLKALFHNNSKNGDLTPILNNYKFTFIKI